MDTLTVLKILDIINNHIAELTQLPGNPIGREQAIQELKLLAKDIKTASKKSKK